VTPTRVRTSIVALAVLVNIVSYTDRACISVVGPQLRGAFGLSPTQLGLVFGSFSLSYALMQAPWGALADRRGARGIVAFAIVWWSAFSALTAAAWNLLTLVLVRFLFGAGESALSPAIASAFGRWVPVRERATAFGAFIGGGRLGGAIAPPIAALLVASFGWRAVFLSFALAGLPAALLWVRWFREGPREHPRVDEAEADLIERGASEDAPSRPAEFLCSRRLFCLLAVSFSYTLMWQFYITWFPTYLREGLGLGLGEASLYAGLPFALGVGANWAGGFFTDVLGRRGDPRFARTVVGFGALAASALLLALGVRLQEPRAAALLIASAAFAGDLFLGAGWASALSIGGKASGTVAGMMNTMSNLGGFVSPILIGCCLQVSHDWTTVLLAACAANVVASLLWLGVNPRLSPQEVP
jgi:MFS family permease